MGGMLLTLLSWPLQAQQRPSSPKAPPPPTSPELGWGQQRVELVEIPNLGRGRAPVDRRQEVDVLATQGVVLPSGYIPEQPAGFLLRSHMIFGAQASAWAWGRVMLTGTFVLSPQDVLDQGLAQDQLSGLNLSVALWRSYDATVSLSGGVLERQGRLDMDSQERGVIGGLVADMNLSDTVVLTLGAQGYLPARRSWDAWSFEACRSRAEFLEGTCWAQQRREQRWPIGGRALLLYGQLAWLAPEDMTLKLEMVSGRVYGTLLSLEGAVYQRDDPRTQTARFEEREATWGPIHGFPVTVHVAMGKRWGRFAAQAGLLLWPADDWRARRYAPSPEPARRDYPAVLPALTLGYQLY